MVRGGIGSPSRSSVESKLRVPIVVPQSEDIDRAGRQAELRPIGDLAAQNPGSLGLGEPRDRVDHAPPQRRPHCTSRASDVPGGNSARSIRSSTNAALARPLATAAAESAGSTVSIVKRKLAFWPGKLRGQLRLERSDWKRRRQVHVGGGRRAGFAKNRDRGVLARQVEPEELLVEESPAAQGQDAAVKREQIGSCTKMGRQPESGLTPCSL